MNDERHQSGHASALDRDRELALVPGAHAALAARHDLAVGRHEPAQGERVLVIDGALVVHAERTVLRLGFLLSVRWRHVLRV